jgi:translation initiation factor 6
MGLYLVEVYRSPNIGIFLRANDSFLLAPKGVAPSKAEKFASDLQVSPCYISVGGTRLLGPLMAMNNKGILVSRMVEDYEIREIASQTGMNVARFASRYTAVGNLVAANDSGAIVSHILEPSAVSQVTEVLGVEARRMEIGDYKQVGATLVPTNGGAAVYPKLTEEEVQEISGIFKVEAYPTSINGGVPFVTSGLVANSRHALVGNLTTGPELVFLTRALKV